jgi:hypothetical protein
MAKLFAKIESEKSEVHKIENRELEIQVFYGSKDDSRLLLKVSVFAKKNAFDLPDVFIKSNTQLKGYTLEPQTIKLETNTCKIENGLCLTHGYSISENVKCPKAIYIEA